MQAGGARLPAVLDRRPVYREGTTPKGFRFVEPDGRAGDRAVAAAARLLDHPKEGTAMRAHTLELPRRTRGHDTVERGGRQAPRPVGAPR